MLNRVLIHLGAPGRAEQGTKILEIRLHRHFRHGSSVGGRPAFEERQRDVQDGQRVAPEAWPDFRPQGKANMIGALLEHQTLSEHRLFAQFVGIEGPPTDVLLPPSERSPVHADIDGCVALAEGRLTQVASASAWWWASQPVRCDETAREGRPTKWCERVRSLSVHECRQSAVTALSLDAPEARIICGRAYGQLDYTINIASP